MCVCGSRESEVGKGLDTHIYINNNNDDCIHHGHGHGHPAVTENDEIECIYRVGEKCYGYAILFYPLPKPVLCIPGGTRNRLIGSRYAITKAESTRI